MQLEAAGPSLRDEIAILCLLKDAESYQRLQTIAAQRFGLLLHRDYESPDQLCERLTAILQARELSLYIPSSYVPTMTLEEEKVETNNNNNNNNNGVLRSNNNGVLRSIDARLVQCASNSRACTQLLFEALMYDDVDFVDALCLSLNEQFSFDPFSPTIPMLALLPVPDDVRQLTLWLLFRDVFSRALALFDFWQRNWLDIEDQWTKEAVITLAMIRDPHALPRIGGQETPSMTFGFTPLQVAAFFGSTRCFEALVRCGAVPRSAYDFVFLIDLGLARQRSPYSERWYEQPVIRDSPLARAWLRPLHPMLAVTLLSFPAFKSIAVRVQHLLPWYLPHPLLMLSGYRAIQAGDALPGHIAVENVPTQSALALLATGFHARAPAYGGLLTTVYYYVVDQNANDPLLLILRGSISDLNQLEQEVSRAHFTFALRQVVFRPDASSGRSTLSMLLNSRLFDDAQFHASQTDEATFLRWLIRDFDGFVDLYWKVPTQLILVLGPEQWQGSNLDDYDFDVIFDIATIDFSGPEITIRALVAFFLAEIESYDINDSGPSYERLIQDEPL